MRGPTRAGAASRRRRGLLRALALAAALSLGARASAAEAPAEDEIPVRNIDRPPALPKSHLRFDAFAVLERADGLGLGGGLGGGYGVTDDLELGVVLFEASLAPSAQVANSLLYALYSFAPLPAVSLSPQLRLSLPLRDPFEVSVGAELAVRLSKPLELAVRPFYSYAFGPEPSEALALPLIIKLQLSERLFFSSLLGATLVERDDHDVEEADQEVGEDLTDFDEVSGLFALEVAYTFGREPGWLKELALVWEWPAFIASAESDARINAGEWNLILAIRLFGEP